MSEAEKSFTEVLPDGKTVKIKIWKDNNDTYLSYNIPEAGLEDASEQELIRLVSGLDSFGHVPAEYRRQAGIADEVDEAGNPVIELTFALGNK